MRASRSTGDSFYVFESRIRNRARSDRPPMSIRYRLVLIMASLSILGVCVSSWLAHTRAEASLKDAAIRQLSGLRRARAYQIESYFRTVRNHVLSLSNDRMFVEAMREFDGAYGRLDTLPNEPRIRLP